jgi:hypothetical protein
MRAQATVFIVIALLVVISVVLITTFQIKTPNNLPSNTQSIDNYAEVCHENALENAITAVSLRGGLTPAQSESTAVFSSEKEKFGPDLGEFENALALETNGLFVRCLLYHEKITEFPKLPNTNIIIGEKEVTAISNFDVIASNNNEEKHLTSARSSVNSRLKLFMKLAEEIVDERISIMPKVCLTCMKKRALDNDVMIRRIPSGTGAFYIIRGDDLEMQFTVY